MKNNFKNIKNYNGIYKINPNGIIKSYHFNKEKILKSSINGNGYCVLYLSKNGIRKMYSVHRLVAETFMPNIKNKPQINHKNGIKHDNQINNLEWATEKQNIQHAYKTKLKIAIKGEDCSYAKLTNSQVRKIKEELKGYKRGMVNDLAKKYNIKRQTVTNIKSNIRWKHIRPLTNT